MGSLFYPIKIFDTLILVKYIQLIQKEKQYGFFKTHR